MMCGLASFLPHALRTCRRFERDVRGAAAVEFALVLPVLLLMLVGAVEITRAVGVDRRVSTVTNMIADLVARETKLSAADVNAIYEIAAVAMAPYDTKELDLSIIPVMSSPSNAANVRVYPTTTNRPAYHKGTVPPACQVYGLPTGVLGKNESVVVIRANYRFVPLWTGYLLPSMDWEKTAIAKPRKALCVAFDGSNCTTTCFSS